MKSGNLICLMEEVQPALRESYAIYNKVITYLNDIKKLNREKPDDKLSSDQKFLLVIGLIFFIFPGIKYYILFKEKNKKINDEINEKIKKLEELIENLIAEYNHKRTYIFAKGITDIVPKNYLYPPSDAFDCILTYLKNDRVNNAEEAINLYIEEKHIQQAGNVPKEQTYEFLLQVHGRYYADMVRKMM